MCFRFRYIICEGYDPGSSEESFGKLSGAAKNHLESTFLQYMTRKFPCIAIQCCKCDLGIPFLVDLTTRNIPVLLLDTSERCFTSSVYDAKLGPQTKLARESNAFPSIHTNQLEIITALQDGDFSAAAMDIFFENACEMLERKMNVMQDNCKIDWFDTSLLAFFHRVVTIGSKIGAEHSSMELCEKIKYLEALLRNNNETKKTKISPEYVNRAIDFIFNRFNAVEQLTRFSCVNRFIEDNDKKYAHFRSKAVALKNDLEKICESINNNNGIMPHKEFDGGKWLAYFELFMSTNTFSGSVFDPDELRHILGSVAKIDRLPSENTVETLRSLQDAWDHVEIYHAVADSYKLISKATYVAILFVGVAIVFFAQVSNFRDSRFEIIALSFAGTMLGSYIGFVNPITKWQQLRVAALSIESNIWMFRTRAGTYRESGEEYDRTSENMFSANLKDIKEVVLEGADIKNTSFFSKAESRNKHGQHLRSARFIGSLDNFQPHHTVQQANRKDEKKRRPKTNRKQSSSNILTDKKAIPLRLTSPGHYDNKKVPLPSSTNYETTLISPKDGNLMSDIYKDKSLNKIAFEATIGGISSINPSTEPKSPEVKRISFYRPEQESDSDDDECKSSGDIEEGFGSSIHEVNRKLFLANQRKTAIPLFDVISDIPKMVSSSGFSTTSSNDIDCHYEPLQPDNYIRFRLLPAMRFYQKKIPQCSRQRQFAQLLMVLGSVGSGLIAIFGFSPWSSVVSILITSISALLEFNGTNSKITRYSSTVHALQDLVQWWQLLPQIDRSVVNNIDTLIIECEGLLQREQQAWQSTSQASKMMSAATDPDKKKE